MAIAAGIGCEGTRKQSRIEKIESDCNTIRQIASELSERLEVVLANLRGSSACNQVDAKTPPELVDKSKLDSIDRQHEKALFFLHSATALVSELEDIVGS